MGVAHAHYNWCGGSVSRLGGRCLGRSASRGSITCGALTNAVQARAGSPFCGVLDALGPPCLTANVRRSAMTAQAYSAALKRLSWPYGAIFFGVVIPGVIGALCLSDRIAASSSWDRSLVFLAMLPVDLAPIILAAWLMEITDRRIGLKCPTCGQSLSLGRHVRGLMKRGGACPKCGVVVVGAQGNAESSLHRMAARRRNLAIRKSAAGRHRWVERYAS